MLTAVECQTSLFNKKKSKGEWDLMIFYSNNIL